MISNYYNPVCIKWGSDSINSLAEVLDSRTKKVLLLTGKNSLAKSGKLDQILKLLNKKEVHLFNDINSNPEIDELFSIKRSTDKFDYNIIVAIGGGSVLDVGKALIAFKNLNIEDELKMKEAVINKSYTSTRINTKLIAIPTTSGTGSELTQWATIWDKKDNKKYSVDDPRLYPERAIIDPILTLNLPLNLTISTALDALSHATEAYWSKKSNEIVRIHALKSIRLIVSNIKPLIENPNNIMLREKLSLGSMFAGLAFSNTRTTVCHSISYPLTAMFDIPHGIATSLTLGEVMRINESSIVDSNLVFNAFQARSVDEVQETINEIFVKAKISNKLRDYGVRRKDLGLITKNAFTPGRVDNNPVLITEDIINNILENIF